MPFGSSPAAVCIMGLELRAALRRVAGAGACACMRGSGAERACPAEGSEGVAYVKEQAPGGGMSSAAVPACTRGCHDSTLQQQKACQATAAP